MGAPSKRAKQVRVEKEFDLGRLVAKLFMPRDGRTTIDSWSFQEIYAAREEQMLGQFVRPARMSEQMHTDDALFTAKTNRLAPLDSIPVKMKPAKGARGASISEEADALFGADGVGLTAATLKSIHACLVDHGVAFAACTATPRDDGSRVDFEAHYWPIEYVRWDPVFRVFKARADPNTVQPGDIPESAFNEYGFVGGYWIPVVHGDGRWIIFSDYEIEPFRQSATILPAALVWARHAFAARDWARGSKSHGSAKVVGELPAGVPLQSSTTGGLSAEAEAFIALLQSIATDNSPAGIRPAGSKTEFVTNNSTAWQVWSELMLNGEKAAARIYLGTDGVLGSQGGAPGVDIEQLFGVAKTKIMNDAAVISRGIDTGLIAPWCAVNFGDSKLAPQRRYLLPNLEREEKTSNYATRNEAYTKSLVAMKQAGLVLTEPYIAQLAKDYRVRVPELASAPTAAPVPGEKAPSAAAVGARATPTASTIALDYNPDEPREADGRFGSGGAGAPPAEKKAPEHHAKEAAAYFKADPGRLQRVHDYTDTRSKDGYRSINASLRAGKPTPAAVTLTEDMKHAPKFEGEVHRSAVVPKEYAQDLKDVAGVPHTAVKANAFWSSSRDEKVARSFARPGDKKDGQTRLMMHMQTHTGVSIENVSRIKGEQEVLISPGTRFRVTKAEKKGDVLHVHMQEIR